MGKNGFYCHQFHQSRIMRLKFHPTESSTLFTCSTDRNLRRIDLQKFKYYTVFKSSVANGTFDFHDSLNDFDFAHDSKLLFLSTNYGKVFLLDPRSPNKVNTLHDNWGYDIRSVSAHPRQPVLAVTDQNTAKIWDIRCGTKILSFLEHKSSVRGVFFSQVDGSHLITTCEDFRFRVFDWKGTISAFCLEHDYISFTDFRPAWHPRDDNLFILSRSLANGKQPFHIPSVGVYSTERKLTTPLIELSSPSSSGFMCLHKTFHPMLDIIASCNPFGEVVLWR